MAATVRLSFQQFFESGTPTSAVTADDTPPARPGPETLPHWSESISLPVIEGQESPPWNRAQIQDHYVPESLPASALTRFYNQFERHRSELTGRLNKTDDPALRKTLIYRFLDDVIFENRELRHLPYSPPPQGTLPGTKEHNMLLAEVNRLLLPQGVMLNFDYFEPAGEMVAIYKVHSINSMSINSPRAHLTIPVIQRNLMQNLSVVPHAPSYPSRGQYSYHLKSIEINPGLMQQRPAMIKTAKIHELMHGYLDQALGVDYTGALIRNKGDIAMEGYVFRQEEYGRFNQKNLHELAGSGFGLMHSGESAHDVALDLLELMDPRYQMARLILMRELLHSAALKPADKEALEAPVLVVATLKQILKKIPITDVHDIGERMAKLAIHLARAD